MNTGTGSLRRRGKYCHRKVAYCSPPLQKSWVAGSDCVTSMTWGSQPEISDNYRQITNCCKVTNFYSPHNARMMRWAKHIACMEDRKDRISR